MRKLVIMSGGFHPFHAGHRDLYLAAKEKFPDAKIVVGTTDDTSERPFPFEIKQALAQLAGVPKSDFVLVNRQFSALEPAIAARVKGQEGDTALIFVRSDKDRGTHPMPPQRDAQGNLPLVTRGARKGQPVSDYLEYYEGNEDRLEPMTKNAYMDYLPVREFGSGMTSATQIRNSWPGMSAEQKQKLVNDMYPITANNKKLTQSAMALIDRGLGIQQTEKKKTLTNSVYPYFREAAESMKSGQYHIAEAIIKEWHTVAEHMTKLQSLLENRSQQATSTDFLDEKKSQRTSPQ